jgi:hypothetical protein
MDNIVKYDSPKNCEICYEPHLEFWNCYQCKNNHCINCKNQNINYSNSCPYCRTLYDNIDKDYELYMSIKNLLEICQFRSPHIEKLTGNIFLMYKLIEIINS